MGLYHYSVAFSSSCSSIHGKTTWNTRHSSLASQKHASASLRAPDWLRNDDISKMMKKEGSRAQSLQQPRLLSIHQVWSWGVLERGGSPPPTHSMTNPTIIRYCKGLNCNSHQLKYDIFGHFDRLNFTHRRSDSCLTNLELLTRLQIKPMVCNTGKSTSPWWLWMIVEENWRYQPTLQVWTWLRKPKGTKAQVSLDEKLVYRFYGCILLFIHQLSMVTGSTITECYSGK